MPHRNWQIRINDILEAIAKIQTYTKGMNEQSFNADQKTVDAIIHNLTVIGEAVVHVPEEVQTQNPDVPWHEMKGIRNVLVHEYFKISKSILWQTITQNLPGLVQPLTEISKK